MSNTTGGWQPGRGGGEPPQVQHDFGSETGPPETGPPDTGPHGTGRTDGGGSAGGVATGADLEARLADLDARLAGLQARLAEAEDQKLRALADLDNLRKRCAAQVERAEADARTQVARQWLPVVDNLERALEHAAADPRTIIEGIQAVRQQALGVLASLGFPRRDDTGAAFDPARHEAVAATYDPRVPPGTVVQVVRPGYGEPDRLLRPAQVVVAKAD
ncbi:MAG TPA: nucleotide exchange factor GrpE [Streptosporangiaceae bacterium]|nr:nucleotide exchange factor GrpE [Streptosporangiaceae bacterium]